MITISTADPIRPKDKFEALLIYNSLDCMLTREVWDVIRPQLPPESEPTYSFALSLQAPVLEMCMRGIKISQPVVQSMLSTLLVQKRKLSSRIDEMARVWGQTGLNPNSPKQLQHFFYKVLKLDPIISYKKGERKIAVDREALEKLLDHHLSEPFARHILAYRDVVKKAGMLSTQIDPDGRMRAAFNIAGTNTGRWSSSAGAFGSGTNFQNITEKLRRPFVADPGHKIAYIDLEQAESRMVGALVWEHFEDPTYLDACESGDLHTLVCKMIWPDLEWPGDPKGDRAIADQNFYLHFSYRDMSKRGGHGTNYYGQPSTMARHLKVSRNLMEEFQDAYFAAFPGISRWHTETARRLQTTGVITTLCGRRRQFHGRLYDDATLRKAIAYGPQSAIGDILNEGLLRLWKRGPEQGVALLAQVHDAVLIQYPEHNEADALALAAGCLEVPITVRGREIIIPTEAASGWNWAYASEKNPDGLKKYVGKDNRQRTEDPDSTILDRLIS
jgi:DNA polymerase-1